MPIMKDKLSELIAYFFAYDKKEHPMHPHCLEILQKTIQKALNSKQS